MITRARLRAASRSPNAATDAGPAPPWSSRNGWVRSSSYKVTGTVPLGPTWYVVAVRAQRISEAVVVMRSMMPGQRGREEMTVHHGTRTNTLGQGVSPYPAG